MIRVINIFLWLSVLLIVLGCANPHKETPKEQTKSTISEIPNIVKALEAIANAGKNKVDKEDEK